MEKVSIVESKEKGGSASKRDPTEWELQKHTNAESIRRLGYLHGGLPSQDVKSEDSTAEILTLLSVKRIRFKVSM